MRTLHCLTFFVFPITEEEIDVVTVEKKNATKSTSNVPTTLGVFSQGRKLVGTLVSRQSGGQRQLALVTTNPNRLQSLKKNDAELNRGRINLQLKSVSVGTASLGSTGATLKRRWTSPAEKNRIKDEIPASNVANLMKLAAPSSLMCISTSGSTKENTSPSGAKAVTVGAKRRGLSLEGVSMVTNTGIKQNREVKVIKPELGDVKLLQTIQLTKGSNSSFTEKRKASKKISKSKIASALAAYETPTSSPGSLNGDAPSPKKRALSGESSTSSGSDEEIIRAAHNVLERQRREGLRTSFHGLRKCVPDLMEQERAPKVLILKKAREHILKLQEEEANNQLEKATEQQRQLALQQRCRELLHSMQLLNTVAYNPSSNGNLKCEVLDVSDTYKVYVD
ncbi:unnamed protein product [Clavelina lepadiformis]|uniref:BHLH domain-containing protein n=1 Tax=Clavelina lepadiformis TaxID=159417 RepID=A0ABP0GHR4_CLALP